MIRLRNNGTILYGTNAERLVYTPDKNSYVWFENDTGDAYLWLNGAWILYSGTGGGGAFLEIANNLADVADPANSLTNIGGEPDLGVPSNDGYVLSSTIAGVRSWIDGGSGGLSDSGFTATLGAAGSWDSLVIPVWQAPKAAGVTILQVNAAVLGASTPTLDFNLNIRAYNTIGSAGTDVFGSAQTAPATGLETTTFATDTLAAKDYIMLTTPSSAESGVVTFFTITVYYEVV